MLLKQEKLKKMSSGLKEFPMTSHDDGFAISYVEDEQGLEISIYPYYGDDEEPEFTIVLSAIGAKRLATHLLSLLNNKPCECKGG
jgi:hypothetical protein